MHITIIINIKNVVRVVSSHEVTTRSVVANDNSTRNGSLLCLCGLDLLGLLLLWGYIAKTLFAIVCP